jgi:hypothetical protein
MHPAKIKVCNFIWHLKMYYICKRCEQSHPVCGSQVRVHLHSYAPSTSVLYCTCLMFSSWSFQIPASTLTTRVRLFVVLPSLSRQTCDWVQLDDQGVGVWVLIGSTIFTYPYHPDLLWGPPSLLSNGFWKLFVAQKETRKRETDIRLGKRPLPEKEERSRKLRMIKFLKT